MSPDFGCHVVSYCEGLLPKQLEVDKHLQRERGRLEGDGQDNILQTFRLEITIE